MKNKKMILLFLIIVLCSMYLFGCGDEQEPEIADQGVTNLIWYQIGETPKDYNLVMEKVNEYTKEKIGVTIQIIYIGWDKYTENMQTIMNTGKEFDLAFTSSWANDYLSNSQRGYFLSLDELLPLYGEEMYQSIDQKFWDAAKVDGKIYAIPNEKELGYMPMWVFTKEYVDKYDIPYETIHSLEDLEPWLELVKENEPDVVPLYLTKDFSIPMYFDKIQTIAGIEYYDETLTVTNLFETSKLLDTLNTMRHYYLQGYINSDASVISDDKGTKRFVTKGDGQPYAEQIWSKDLGYEVVTSAIMEPQITNISARGALTAISAKSQHAKEAVILLNLINTDEYLRNLLNYGIEGIHYDKVELTEEEQKLAETTENAYNFKVQLNTENMRNYSVPYWVQGGLFNTYVLDTEPVDKWEQFKIFNQNVQPALTFGFDFDSSSVLVQSLAIQSILEEFAAPLYTGSVDPDVYVPLLNQKLYSVGLSDIINEMQSQINEWKENK